MIAVAPVNTIAQHRQSRAIQALKKAQAQCIALRLRKVVLVILSMRHVVQVSQVVSRLLHLMKIKRSQVIRLKTKKRKPKTHLLKRKMKN